MVFGYRGVWVTHTHGSTWEANKGSDVSKGMSWRRRRKATAVEPRVKEMGGGEGNRGSHFVLSQHSVMPHGLYRFLTVNPCVTSLKLTLLLQILQILNYTQYTYTFWCTEILHVSFTNFKIHTWAKVLETLTKTKKSTRWVATVPGGKSLFFCPVLLSFSRHIIGWPTQHGTEILEENLSKYTCI